MEYFGNYLIARQFCISGQRFEKRRRIELERDVLQADQNAFPLVGRSDELAQLQSWLDDDVDISVHALIAPAGSGQTRLGMELCRRIVPVDAAEDAWLAGFVDSAGITAMAEAFVLQPFE